MKKRLESVSRQSGFTFVEILLTIALMGILFAMSAPIYQSLQTNNDLDIAINTIAQSSHRAQTLSQAVDGDSTWGLKVQSGSIVLFQGVDYASRDVSFDEVYDLPGAIVPSGLQELTFAKLSGEPSTTGTFILASSNNETRTATINTKGIVEY